MSTPPNNQNFYPKGFLRKYSKKMGMIELTNKQTQKVTP
jgi:hypothetical protein